MADVYFCGPASLNIFKGIKVRRFFKNERADPMCSQSTIEMDVVKMPGPTHKVLKFVWAKLYLHDYHNEQIHRFCESSSLERRTEPHEFTCRGVHLLMVPHTVGLITVGLISYFLGVLCFAR